VLNTSQMLAKEFLGNLLARDERCLGRAVFAARCSVIARYPANDNLYGPAVLWTLLGDPALRIKHRIGAAVEEPSPKLGVRTRVSVASASPNPCDRSTTVRLSSPLATPYSLSLFDTSGRLVYSQPVRTSSSVLCTSSFPNGVYIVRCLSGVSSVSARLLIQHR